MKTNKNRKAPKKKLSWAEIVLAAMSPVRGKRVPLEIIYEAVERHPVARARAKSNQHIRDKVRQQLQMLRDDGRVDWISPGVWRLPRRA